MDKITQLINDFDYLDVLAHAPDDEYEYEIKLIKQLLVHVNDPHQLAVGIQKIFFDQCSEGCNYNNYTFEDFLTLATKILE